MALPLAYALNLLESSAVTVSGEATGKEKARLYDRRIVAPWEDSASGTRTITLQQIGTLQAIDRVVLAADHNLGGVSCDVDRSTNGSSWTLVTNFTGAAGLQIVSLGSLLTYEWWRLAMTSAPAAPSIPELLFTALVTFPRAQSADYVDGALGNIAESESRAGVVFTDQRGADRWMAEWTIRLITAAGRATLESLWQTVAGRKKPFYLTDDLGVTRWVRFRQEALNFQAIPGGRFDVDLDLIEAL